MFRKTTIYLEKIRNVKRLYGDQWQYDLHHYRKHTYWFLFIPFFTNYELIKVEEKSRYGRPRG